MAGSLVILGFFAMGIILAHAGYIPEFLLEHDPTLPALWLMMGCVGLSLGSDRKLAEVLRFLKPSVLLIPVGTTIGTFAGAFVAALCVNWSVWECLAVGSGFAYYSLSSIFITQAKGPDLGAVALMSNIMRELFTLMFTPLLVKYFGPIAAISAGGASTSDTTLPIISKHAGINWVLPSVIHAVILDFSVPFWVTLFCSL